MKVKFLFVIPTLNSSDDLILLLNSLKNQTYPHWRVFFVDGQSKQEHQQWLKDCCLKDNRFSWVEQKENKKGIYPAMNYGFDEVKNDEWLLFWGSDDYASDKKILENLKNKIHQLEKKGKTPHFIFARGSYIDNQKRIVRKSKFNLIINYKISLLFGNSPVHQATLIGPGVNKSLGKYSKKYYLASDLDYFCRLSLHKGLRFFDFQEEIVRMRVGGVSQRRNKQRFKEVFNIYKDYFGILFLIPFILRYLLRFYSLIAEFKLW